MSDHIRVYNQEQVDICEGLNIVVAGRTLKDALTAMIIFTCVLAEDAEMSPQQLIDAVGEAYDEELNG